MQRVEFSAQQVHRFNADLQVLADRAFIESVGRTRQFDFTVQRLVRNAEQRAVRDPQAITLRCNRAAFHVHGHGAGQVDQRSFLRPAQFPVTVVVGQHGAGAQAFFQIIALLASDIGGSLLQRHLHFRQGRDRDVRRHHTVENAVATHVSVGQHIVADGLRLTQAAAVADHQPAMRTQHRQVVGDVLGVGRADADVDQRHAVAIAGDQVIGRHLVSVPDHTGRNRRCFAVIHALLDDHVARQHHAHETRVAAQLFQTMDDELVDVAVIVGQ
ncbi:hypothetical protein D3C85_556460 [compost metagenome]